MSSHRDDLSKLLDRNTDSSRDEPEVAANIGEQLKHMELKSLPISLRRRIRDVVAQIKPQNIVEVGAGIGHLSAWLFDEWETTEHTPSRYIMVEAGGKFGVILTRLIERYNASKWAQVVVGEWNEIIAEQRSWVAANTSSSENSMISKSPLPTNIDICIIDVGWENQNACIMGAVPLLGENSIILTSEPDVPDENETDENKIAAFNEWIVLVKMLNETHEIGFVPMFGGTLIGIRKVKR